jgi:archaellum component FlaC
MGGERKQDAALTSELRFYELSFLTLTVLSPFFGAALLRQITTLVAGAEIISWFSTSLFVLATGIRPWRHFIERISHRTEEIHDRIHYPPMPENDASRTFEMDRKMEEMAKRLASLETTMGKMRAFARDSKEEHFEYVDDAMEGVQKVVKRIDKRNERQDERLKSLESSVETLRKSKGKSSLKELPHIIAGPRSPSVLEHLLPSWLLPKPIHSPPSPSSPILRHSLRSFPTSPRLETIMEEDAKPNPRYRLPLVDLVFHWGDLATLPLRAILSYLFGRRS